MRRTIFCFCLCAGLAGCSQPTVDTDMESDIWRLEEQYLATFQKGDTEGLLRFYHPNFIGWPAQSSEPLDLKAGREFMEAMDEKADMISFEIRPGAIRITGDVALVHYSVALVQQGVDGVTSGSVLRVTHTWMNTRSGWRIMGGMSADLPSFV